MTREYENWVKVEGSWFCERSDVTDSVIERNIIEARYRWAISRLRKHRIRDVLDVGSGLGYGTSLISKAGFNVEGIDKSETAVEVSRKRYPHIKFMLGGFPAGVNSKYDAIVANEIIEHVTDHEAFISGCFKILKSGGLLLLSTPNRKYTKCRNPHHVREFTLQELKELFPRGKIRAFSSRLIRGHKLLLLFMSKERLQKLVFQCSKLPIIYHMPRYALYSLIEIRKPK